jgi:hypothetical protein
MMGGERAKEEHCGNLDGRKPVEGWSRVVAERGKTAFSVACMLYERLFAVQGELAKHGARKAFFSVLCELFILQPGAVCVFLVSVRIESIAKRRNICVL